MTLFIATPVSVEESTETIESYSNYVIRHFTAPLEGVTVKQAYCLAQAIYHEAGNQSSLGKEAVAIVVINRTTHGRYPRTICGVVRQSHVVRKDEDDVSILKRVCQFSFWCETHDHVNTKIWKESVEIANRVLKNYWQRDTLVSLNSALYFHADYANPKWRKDKVFLTKIGKHLFYAEKPKPV